MSSDAEAFRIAVIWRKKERITLRWVLWKQVVRMRSSLSVDAMNELEKLFDSTPS
jgi:hypothetical protein